MSGCSSRKSPFVQVRVRTEQVKLDSIPFRICQHKSLALIHFMALQVLVLVSFRGTVAFVWSMEPALRPIFHYDRMVHDFWELICTLKFANFMTFGIWTVILGSTFYFRFFKFGSSRTVLRNLFPSLVYELYVFPVSHYLLQNHTTRQSYIILHTICS